MMSMTRVILRDMKTAISVPDELFRQAEALAKRLGIPRSQLYARALGEYLDTHGPDHVTNALNAVYTEGQSTLEPTMAAAQAAAIAEDEW